MSHTIHKFDLSSHGDTQIMLPETFEVLNVEVRRGSVCMWAIVDLDHPKRLHTILCRGTGHTFSGSEGRYLGSVQLLGGTFVMHYFVGALEGAPRSFRFTISEITANERKRRDAD